MRVRYSFSSRRTGRLENIRKQKQEFPEVVEKLINSSDIILEILDARFIKETRNIDLEEYIKNQGKRLIFVINKTDIISKERINKKGLNGAYPYVFVSCKTRKGSKDLRNRIKIESKKIQRPVEKSGKITIGIIGYPNTGKSSLINMMIGRHKAGTGSEAGYTKGIQKLKLTPEIYLIDSPGVIPKKEYSSVEQLKIVKQAKIGGRSFSQVKEPELVVANIMKEFRGVLEHYYNIKAKSNSELLIEELGKRKGFLKKGGLVDEDRTARFILKEWQEGKIKI